MKNLYNDKEAERIVSAQADQGIGVDLAHRLYTSRLLGRNQALVRHGGGNTSVKAPACDTAGRIVDALYIKGSGQELAALDLACMPALNLAQLMELQRHRRLDDRQMVRALRAARHSS